MYHADSDNDNTKANKNEYFIFRNNVNWRTLSEVYKVKVADDGNLKRNKELLLTVFSNVSERENWSFMASGLNVDLLLNGNLSYFIV